MRIIGKKSKETLSSCRAARITIMKDRIYFTKAAMSEFGISSGDKIKLLVEPPFYGFYKTDKTDKDGYSVSMQYQGGGIQSMGIVNFFRQEFSRHKEGFSFILEATKNEINGTPIVQIKTNNCYTYKYKKP